MNKKLFILSICLVLAVASVFAVLYKSKHRKNDYWKDGKNFGKEVSVEELKVLKTAEDAVIKFKKSLDKDETVALHHLSTKIKEVIASKNHVDYKSLSEDKDQKALIRKMFKARREYRKALSKDELKSLRSAISKLSLKEKQEMGDNFFIL